MIPGFPAPVFFGLWRVCGESYALRFAQAGVKHENAKPVRGFTGAGVLEVIEDFDGNTYRAIYTVRFAGVVYVLHCFQKKSKKGIATPRRTIELVYQRLKAAQALHRKWSENG